MKEENNKISFILNRVAPCGLHCGECFAYKYSHIHKNSIELRNFFGEFKPYAERFSKTLNPVFEKYPDFETFLDYLVNSECKGCRQEQCKFYKDCKVRSCTEKNNINFCYQCSKFPCDDTGLNENLYKRYILMNNKIKSMGLEAYYNEIEGKTRY